MSKEQNEGQRYTPELFPDPQDTAAWFAGALEVGAATGIGVSEWQDKGGYWRIKATPFLEIHSSSPPMLRRLYSIYGGMLTEKFWNKSGKVAAEIVADTYPFIVARKEHALAMINLLNAESMEEKVEIARDLESKDWQQKGNQTVYERLLRNPVFVAGILDSRATMFQKKARHHYTLSIQVPSKNLALLYALEEKFAGEVRVTDPAGTVVKHGEVSFITKVDSHVWDIVGSDAIELIEYTQQYLQTPPIENWDYQRKAERRNEEERLAQTIAAHVRQEMQLLQNGQIANLSSNGSLANIFGVNKTRVSRYLEQTLPPQELELRYSLIKQYATRKIDAITAQQITDYIKQEISLFRSGEINRISSRHELAEMFGIDFRAIAHYVINPLPSELKNTRTSILNSQSARDRNISYWTKKRDK